MSNKVIWMPQGETSWMGFAGSLVQMVVDRDPKTQLYTAVVNRQYVSLYETDLGTAQAITESFAKSLLLRALDDLEDIEDGPRSIPDQSLAA